jgi:long-chain-fatty-acid--[acyl-carrier-protein] ligase
MKLVFRIYRFILSLRYNIIITWRWNLSKYDNYLILPNHVALVDPQIILSCLWKYIKVSPVASEKYYNKPILKNIMKSLWTVPVWEISAWSDPKEIKNVYSNISNEMNNKKNILIYPSWQIYKQWFESIIWKQMTYNVVNSLPKNTKILWIKTRWLWWSMFSTSRSNWQDSIYWLMLKWLFYIIANLIFFVPKRKITIEIFDITNDINKWKKQDLDTFNKNLENFYNTENNENYIEKINYIKHFFYFNDVKNKKELEIITWSLKELSKSSKIDLKDIDNDIIEKISKKIKEIKNINDNIEINIETNLILDLYFDSLDMAEIKSYIQWNFNKSSNPSISSLKTLWDLVIMAVWKSATVEKLKKCDWWISKQKWLLIEKFYN